MHIVEDINDEEHFNEKYFLKMAIDATTDEVIRKKIMERKNRSNRNGTNNYKCTYNTISIGRKKRWETSDYVFFEDFHEAKNQIDCKVSRIHRLQVALHSSMTISLGVFKIFLSSFST